MSDQASSGQCDVNTAADILQLGEEIRSLRSSVGQILSYLHGQSHPPSFVPDRGHTTQSVSAEILDTADDSRELQENDPSCEDNGSLQSHNISSDDSGLFRSYNPSVTSEPSIETTVVTTSVDDVTSLLKGMEQQDMTAGDDIEKEDSFIVLETFSSTKTEKLEDNSATCVSNATGKQTVRKSLSSSSTMQDQIQHLTQKVEHLENRLCDRIDISMSKFQSEMKEIILSTARSSQVDLQTAVMQQTTSFEDIKDMTGQLSNQLNTVIEQTHDVTTHVASAVSDVTKNLQISDHSLQMLTSLNTGNVEEIKARLKEMVEAAENSIKARNMSDLAWLKGEMEERLQKITENVGEISTDTKTLASKTEMATDLLCEQMKDLTATLNEKMLHVLSEGRTASQESTKTITEKVEELQISAASVHEIMVQSISEVTDKLSDPSNVSNQQLIDEVQKIVKHRDEDLQEYMQNILNLQGDNTRIHINNKIQSLEDSLHQQNQDTQTQVDTKMAENTKQLKENMYKLKREIFTFTEKECQIVRDRIDGRLPALKTYVLDFYVEDFKSLISSDARRYSVPWHINQFKSSLQGKVWFLTTGKMGVWMLYSRNPREVGLQPRQCGRLKVKVTIADTTGRLRDLNVGEWAWNATEEDIKCNAGWGHMLGVVDCQDIVNGGHADIADYLHKAVLVRFVVDIL